MKNHKGPWAVKNYDTQIEVTNNIDEIIAFIPIDDEIEPLENDQSNANLISAAPEMITALELVIGDDRLMNALTGNQVRSIVDAVRKARGEK